MSEYNDKERRQFNRGVFSPTDQLELIYVIKEHEKNIKTAQIMNISEGGIGLAINRTDIEGIQEGTRLIVTEIVAKGSTFKVKGDFWLDVIWILDHRFLENIGFGCEYAQISEDESREIFLFINDHFPGKLSK